jgi:hypothetical protein
MERFDELLIELGKLLDIPLHADKHRACRLRVNDVLDVQIESSQSKDQLVIASFLAEIPPGKFRETVLKEALKANSVFPRLGTFAYFENTSQLVLFDFLPLHQLSGDALQTYLLQFIDKATLWKTGVETGRIPSFK